MSTPRIRELQSVAVAALEEAESLLRSAELSDHEEDGWRADFAKMLADGMSACRWFVGMGFRTPGNFGYWLIRASLDEISMRSSHEQLDDAVRKVSSALRELDKESERWWSQQTDAEGT